MTALIGSLLGPPGQGSFDSRRWVRPAVPLPPLPCGAGEVGAELGAANGVPTDLFGLSRSADRPACWGDALAGGSKARFASLAGIAPDLEARSILASSVIRASGGGAGPSNRVLEPASRRPPTPGTPDSMTHLLNRPTGELGCN